MAVTLGYRPMPVFIPFHASSAYERALFGAFGSGKTYAICAEALVWLLEQPGIRGLIARKTVPELRDTTEPIFVEMIPPELYRQCEVRRSGGHIERIIMPNGSEVLFRSLDNWDKHRSLNVGFIAYDEANEIDEETYRGMASRVRQRDITARARELGHAHEITRRGIWLATNPGGHDWLWRRFHPESKERQEGTEHFISTTLDNPYLPPEYVESLLQYPEPWVRRYVLCQFDDFAGRIYEDWAWDTHVVPPLKEIPAGSVHWMALDPGTRSPTAGLWVVMNPADRSLTAIAEYQEGGVSADRHAAEWRRIEARHRMNVRWRVADPTITTRDRGSNLGLDQQYRKLGFSFALGPKREQDRIPALGLLVAQRRFRATTNCPMLHEAMTQYQWEDLTPAQRAKGLTDETAPEKPDKRNSHLVDCGQYLASRWVKGVAPRPQPTADGREEFSEEVWRAVRKQVRRRRPGRSRRGDLPGVVV